MAANEPIDRPELPNLDDPELAPFWEGCRAGELRVPRCEGCAAYVWYPQPTCPKCGGESIRWTPVSGRGRLFTWVRVHRAFVPGLAARVPYTTAIVELEEDPCLRLTTLLDVPENVALRIGLPVEAGFEPIDEKTTLPKFRFDIAKL